jgi:hypothetical protein
MYDPEIVYDNESSKHLQLLLQHFVECKITTVVKLSFSPVAGWIVVTNETMELDMGNLTWTQIMYRPMHHIQNNVLIL